MKKMVLVTALIVIVSAKLMAQKAEVFSNSSRAISGYDPVAYFKEGRGVKGSKAFTTKWNDATWYFSSKQNLDSFVKSPQKFAPQYGGYCAYGMSDGHKAPTDPAAWTIVNGKLYLNYSLKVKEYWNKEQQERIKKADDYWPELKNKE